MGEYEICDISTGRINKETLKWDPDAPTCLMFEVGVTNRLYKFRDGTVKGMTVYHCYDINGKPIEFETDPKTVENLVTMYKDVWDAHSFE